MNIRNINKHVKVINRKKPQPDVFTKYSPLHGISKKKFFRLSKIYPSFHNTNKVYYKDMLFMNSLKRGEVVWGGASRGYGVIIDIVYTITNLMYERKDVYVIEPEFMIQSIDCNRLRNFSNKAYFYLCHRENFHEEAKKEFKELYMCLQDM